jgi:hypothetical protein
MSAAGGQDDQRLVGEVTEGGSLLARGVRLDVSSIVLRNVLGVATLARTSSRDRGGRLPKADWPYRRPRPSRAETETSAATRLMSSLEPPWPGDGVPGFAAGAGAVESTSTMPATSSG